MIRIHTNSYRIQNFVTIYQKLANRWRFDGESRFGNSRTIRDRFEDDSRSIRDLESERTMNMSSCFTWFWISKTIRGCQIRGRFEVSYLIFIHTFIICLWALSKSLRFGWDWQQILWKSTNWYGIENMLHLNNPFHLCRTHVIVDTKP